MPGSDLPLPDLDGPVAGKTWRVRASAFRDPVGDAERVAAALGLELASARQLVASAPVLIGAGSTRAEAEKIANALRGLGARVLVEDASAGPSSEPPSSVPAPKAPSLHPPSPADRALDDAPARSFWVEVPVAFIAPFLGRGWLAILGTGAVGAAMLLVFQIPGLILRLGGGFALLFLGVGAIAELFGRLAQAALAREPGSLPEPDVAMPAASSLVLRGLFTVIVLLVFGGIVWTVGQSVAPEVVLFVAFLPYVYWPMGLTVQGVSGRLTGVIDVVAVARGILAAPIEYAIVVLVSFFLLVLMTFGTLAATLGGAAAGEALETPSIVLYVLGFAYFAGLAYVHGVLGYLMGALVAAKSDRFGFLVDG